MLVRGTPPRHRLKLLTASGLLLAMAVVVVICFHGGGAKASSSRQKLYAQVLAKGLRYLNPAAGVGGQCLSFKSCRIEKRKSGWITFGAFNVLVIEDLVVTRPPPPASLPADILPRDRQLAEVAAVATLEPEQSPLHVEEPAELLFGEALRPFLQRRVRISGLCIRGLKINRAEGRNVRLLLSANRAELDARGGRLSLSGGELHRDDGTLLRLKNAALVLKPVLSVIYEAGDGTKAAEVL